MTAEQFAERLARFAPSRAELEEHGLEPDEIESVGASFRCERRPNVEKPPGPASELERLVSLFDCTTVAVTQVEFLSAPRRLAVGVQVAQWEADPIVVDAGGRVLAFDHARPGTLLAECSQDSEHFLDALAALAGAVAHRALWRGRRDEVLSDLCDRAGGERFRRFLSALAGSLGER